MEYEQSGDLFCHTAIVLPRRLYSTPFMYVDLHIHTDVSDGTWDTDELMPRILAADISLFSITDHDAILNSYKMSQTINSYPEFHGRFVIGAEASCTWKGTLYHITAYDFDPTNIAFQELLFTNTRILQQYNDATIEALSQMLPGFDYEKYLAYRHNPKHGGWKGLNFMLDEGVIQNLSEFFTLLNKVDHTMEFPDPDTVISTIRDAGGHAFMAHPKAVYRDHMMPETDLRQWIEFGIAGLECYSTYCTLEEAEEYVKLCQKHNLCISAGSDCHGTFILERRLGHPRVTPDMVNLPF
jgi:predicted metal-dependent phosphoesterase TrpH